MRYRSLEVCLLIISTTAWLSEKKTIHLSRMIDPQISTVRTIGIKFQDRTIEIFPPVGPLPEKPMGTKYRRIT